MHYRDNWWTEHVDVMLIIAGMLVAIGLPTLLMHQGDLPLHRDEIPQMIALQPELAYACAFFLISGLAVVIVGCRGLLGNYASTDARGKSVMYTSGLVIGIAIGFYVLCFVASGIGEWLASDANTGDTAEATVPSYLAEPLAVKREPSSATKAKRWAIACLGGMVGFHLATFRPPPDSNKIFWFTVLGAAAAWFVAETIFDILLVAGSVLFFVRFVWPHLLPHIRDLLARRQQQTVATTQSNDQRQKIAELRQQIQWTANSGAPQQFRDEEISRLKRQIHDLGGAP